MAAAATTRLSEPRRRFWIARALSIGAPLKTCQQNSTLRDVFVSLTPRAAGQHSYVRGLMT
jgi:hypothetical protein